MTDLGRCNRYGWITYIGFETDVTGACVMHVLNRFEVTLKVGLSSRESMQRLTAFANRFPHSAGGWFLVGSTG